MLIVVLLQHLEATSKDSNSADCGVAARSRNTALQSSSIAWITVVDTSTASYSSGTQDTSSGSDKADRVTTPAIDIGSSIVDSTEEDVACSLATSAALRIGVLLIGTLVIGESTADG